MKRHVGFALIALGVLGAWCASWFLIYAFLPTWAERGQFGDLFGAVNALFSGLAFLGLIYAIRLQALELSLQRDELKLQREEMAATREQIRTQAEVQKAHARAAVAQLKAMAAQIDAEAIKAAHSGVVFPSVDTLPMQRAAKEIRGIASDLESDLV